MARKKEAVTSGEMKLKHDKKLAVLGTYTPESELTWHITHNPRSANKATHQRFSAYFGSPTVGKFLAAGGTKGDLLWDLRSGYVSIEGVTLSADAPRKERKARVKKETAVPTEQAVAEEVIG
jgi:hypothetical protein